MGTVLYKSVKILFRTSVKITLINRIQPKFLLMEDHALLNCSFISLWFGTPEQTTTESQKQKFGGKIASPHRQMMLPSKCSLPPIWEQKQYIVSSMVGTSPFLRDPPPPILGIPFFWSKFKKLPPLSESNPNWCMQIVRNSLKWRCYVSHYPKSIEKIINITLFTFRLNSVFTTDTFFG